MTTKLLTTETSTPKVNRKLDLCQCPSICPRKSDGHCHNVVSVDCDLGASHEFTCGESSGVGEEIKCELSDCGETKSCNARLTESNEWNLDGALEGVLKCAKHDEVGRFLIRADHIVECSFTSRGRRIDYLLDPIDGSV